MEITVSLQVKVCLPDDKAIPIEQYLRKVNPNWSRNPSISIRTDFSYNTTCIQTGRFIYYFDIK